MDKPVSEAQVHKDDYLTLAEIERNVFVNRLKAYRGQLTRTAKSLGIGRATMYRKIKEYNLDLEKIRSNL